MDENKRSNRCSCAIDKFCPGGQKSDNNNKSDVVAGWSRAQILIDYSKSCLRHRRPCPPLKRCSNVPQNWSGARGMGRERKKRESVILPPSPGLKFYPGSLIMTCFSSSSRNIFLKFWVACRTFVGNYAQNTLVNVVNLSPWNII